MTGIMEAATPMTGFYDYRLVALSVAIAIFASYAALDLAGRVTATRGRWRLIWLTGGAIAMGLGIWSMHYVGMLAFNLPVRDRYDVPTVLLSLLAAIAASAIALFVVSRQTMGWWRALLGSFFMGAGIAIMHYTGMAAMRLPAMHYYNLWLVALSVVLAMVISLVALGLTFRVRDEDQRVGWRKVASAVVMGAAIPAMHYTGMAAATFVPAHPHSDMGHAVDISLLGHTAIILTTLVVLAFAVLTSRLGRRLSAQARQLQMSEQRYQLLFDSSPHPAFVFDPGTLLFLAANQAAVRTYGFSAEEFLAMQISEILPLEDVPQLLSCSTQGAQSPGRLESWQHRSKNGAWFPVEASVGRISWAGKPAALVLAMDITDRKSAEETLRESELKYRKLFEEAKDAILIFRPEDEVILEANPAACEVYGFTRDQLVGLSLRSLTVDALEGDKRIRTILDCGTDRDFETAHLRSDGSAMALIANARVTDYQGERVIMAWIRDVTEQKRMEALERERRLLLEMVAQNSPLSSSLNQVVRIMENLLPGGFCAAALLKANKLCHVATSRQSQGALAFLEGLDAARSASSLGLVAERRETVSVEGVGGEPGGDELCRSAGACGLKSCWCVPILSADGAVLGMLLAFFSEVRTRQPKDSERLVMASQMAAVAIEHRSLTDKLSHQAEHDALTGLPNRVLLEDRLQQAIVRANRYGSKVALMAVDLDGFKSINDTLGHHAGDEVLREVARRLRGVTRQTDTVARIGGDEFLIVLSELADPRDSIRVAENCLEAVQRPIRIGEREYSVSASIGISHYPENTTETEMLRQMADSAMYDAKFRGKNGFQVFTEQVSAQARERLELMHDLRQALENQELELHYQPQFLSSGKMDGFEALLRWQHPQLGLVPPSRFIPLAEETGLIIPIGNWALKEACRQMVAWRQAGFTGLRVAVNVSVLQFEREDWIGTVAQVLQETGLPPSCLELELTESLVMHRADRAADRLAQLRSLGVSSAIDDFGTGYSSLKYLHQFPIDTLKIDQSFVRNLGDPSSGRSGSGAIVRTIIALAQSLNLRVVAEGVETERELKTLRRLGCDLIQGYLFAKPMPARECEILLRQERRSADRGKRMVEAAGVEPASENLTGPETTCVVAFPLPAFAGNLRRPRSERTRNAES